MKINFKKQYGQNFLRDDNLLASFKENPIKVVEKVLKVDLPDEILEKIVEVVKTKINVDDAKEALGKIAGLFGKD